ncbi:unnamed protein product, partial [Alternaria alternata]
MNSFPPIYQRSSEALPPIPPENYVDSLVQPPSAQHEHSAINSDTVLENSDQNSWQKFDLSTLVDDLYAPAPPDMSMCDTPDQDMANLVGGLPGEQQVNNVSGPFPPLTSSHGECYDAIGQDTGMDSPLSPTQLVIGKPEHNPSFSSTQSARSTETPNSLDANAAIRTMLQKGMDLSEIIGAVNVYKAVMKSPMLQRILALLSEVSMEALRVMIRDN